MKTLIADDELPNRILLNQLLSPFGECDLVINGQEAVEAFEFALEDGNPFDLICLDIMMPVMNGQQALKTIRQLETEHGITGVNSSVIFMVSALDTEDQVVQAFFKGGCTDYLTKPISKEKLHAKLKENRFIAF